MRVAGVFAVACFGLWILSGCNAHSRAANTAKPTAAVQPLFTPVAASLEQQKMCADQAAKVFKENGHSKFDNYTDHYDPTVNVCYIRVNSSSFDKFPTDAMVVYDAFGGRVYANYMWINAQNKKFWEVPPSECEIHIPDKPVKKCNSAEEFDQLTEKYFGVSE